MKKESVFKILKIFICALMSVVFVLGVVAVPFFYSITALTKPETVENAMKVFADCLDEFEQLLKEI